MRELVESRLIVVGLDIKHSTEGSVNLGIPLSQTENTQEILNRVKAADEQILSVEVFAVSGADGNRLFGTDAEGIGKKVPESWVNGAESKDSNTWQFDEPEAFGVGIALINSFNKRIGGIVVRYSRAYQQTKIEAMFQSLARTVLIVFGIACVLAFIGVYVFFRPISTTFSRMTASLTGRVPAGRFPMRARDPPTPYVSRRGCATGRPDDRSR